MVLIDPRPTTVVPAQPAAPAGLGTSVSGPDLDRLRAAARDRIYFPDGTVDRAAMRELVTLDGNLAVGEILSRCECGGLLTSGPGRRWMHVDRCDNCRDNPGDCDDTDRSRHPMCLTPAPRQCTHPHCIAFVDLTAEPCLHGRDDCSGCCHGDPELG